MADSSSNLPLLANASAGRDVQANGLFDPMSTASLFGRNWVTSSALTWGYLGGKYRKADGTIITVANGTLSLTASATNYIKETDGVVSVTTAAPSGWPSPLASNAKALYAVVCGASSVTSYTDYRTTGIGSGNTAGGGGTSSPLTTKGDLWGFSTINDRLPVGTNGQQLVADSTQALGVKWASEPFDVTAFYPGVPASSAKVLRVPIARAVTFPANFSGSYGKAATASTGTATFDIQKNGSSVGSMVFTAASTATFTTAGGTAVSFAAGDVLAIIAPSSADATLADVGAVLAGTR